MEAHVVITVVVVRNALKIILKCVLVLFVLLEEQTIVVLLQSYVKNTEEYENVKRLVRLDYKYLVLNIQLFLCNVR